MTRNVGEHRKNMRLEMFGAVTLAGAQLAAKTDSGMVSGSGQE